MSLSELENMSLEQKRLTAMAESTQPMEQDTQQNDEMEVSKVYLKRCISNFSNEPGIKHNHT